MMIVLGGTVAATAVAFRLNEVTRVLGIIKFAFTKPKFKLQELVQAVIELAEINRKGPSELEKAIPNIKFAFLQDGVTFVTQGMKLEDLREILQQRESFRYKRELHESELMKTMGTYSPAFGMVGTLIGLVFMLFGMGSSSEGGDGGMGGFKLLEECSGVIRIGSGSRFGRFDRRILGNGDGSGEYTARQEQQARQDEPAQA